MKTRIHTFFPTLFILVLAFSFNACEKKSDDLSASELLIGYWGNPELNDSVISYSKIKNTDDPGFDIAFMSDNTLVQKQIAGWCGTPPVAYALYNGHWSIADSVISYTVDYWGGTIDRECKIVKVSNDELIFSILSEETHPDY